MQWLWHWQRCWAWRLGWRWPRLGPPPPFPLPRPFPAVVGEDVSVAVPLALPEACVAVGVAVGDPVPPTTNPIHPLNRGSLAPPPREGVRVGEEEVERVPPPALTAPPTTSAPTREGLGVGVGLRVPQLLLAVLVGQCVRVGVAVALPLPPSRPPPPHPKPLHTTPGLRVAVRLPLALAHWEGEGVGEGVPLRSVGEVVGEGEGVKGAVPEALLLRLPTSEREGGLLREELLEGVARGEWEGDTEALLVGALERVGEGVVVGEGLEEGEGLSVAVGFGLREVEGLGVAVEVLRALLLPEPLPARVRVGMGVEDWLLLAPLERVCEGVALALAKALWEWGESGGKVLCVCGEWDGGGCV